MIKNISRIFILFFLLFVQCKNEKTDMFSPNSQIVICNNYVLVNNQKNELISYDFQLNEIKRFKIETEDILNIFSIKNDIYGVIEFTDLTAKILKFNKDCDSILWKSKVVDFCVEPWRDIIKNNEEILFSCDKDYLINDKTGKIRVGDVKKKVKILNRINAGKFVYRVNISSDSIIFDEFNRGYLLTKEYLFQKDNSTKIDNYIAFSKFSKGFVIINPINENGRKITFVDPNLEKLDEFILDFEHAKFQMQNQYLIFQDLLEGIVIYNLEKMSIVKKISNSKNDRFYDIAINDNSVYMLNSNGISMFNLN